MKQQSRNELDAQERDVFFFTVAELVSVRLLVCNSLGNADDLVEIAALIFYCGVSTYEIFTRNY